MNRRERRAQERKLSPSDAAQALLEQAGRYHQAGQSAAAERLYRQVLLLDPRQAEAPHRLGSIAAAAGRHDEAADLFRAAIAIDPVRPASHAALGEALDASGWPHDAATALREAIRLQPGHARAHAALGTVLQGLGQLEEAASSYGVALRHQGGLLDARCNLGSVLRRLGRPHDAIAAYRAALRTDPAFAAAHYNLGNALGDVGRHDEAVAAYAAALRLRPDDVQARLNLGGALNELGRLHEALDNYDAVLRHQPDHATAHFNRGAVLKEMGRMTEAVAAFEAAIRLRPDHAAAHSNLLASAHYVYGIGPAVILDRARRYARLLEFGPPPAFHNDPDPHRRLRIGLVSPDLGHHPVGHFLAPVLACHDRSAVEVTCYSDRDRADPLADRLRAGSDRWRRLTGLDDAAAAALIRADTIDILIDLAGHTALNRLPMFAAGAAPVQATWLGYWGTTGLACMDYILSDRVTIPPDEESHYSERVLRLPNGRFCYEAPVDAPEPSPPPCLRRGAVTFGSFNNLSKLGPEVVQAWAAVLHAVPGSRLLLKWRSLGDGTMRQRVAAAFAQAGIATQRLELRAASPHAAMLAEYADLDIALDPFPFCGGLTSCEALWMGVPVVTLPGGTPQSRQTIGFLRALGQDGWAAGSIEDYVAIAAALAADPAGLAERRQTQRARMATSPLCDGPGFTRDLEAALRRMWIMWCEGQGPALDAPRGAGR